MDLVTISIPNWGKYNPRSDRANYSWFRMQNDFFHDQRLFGLSDAQLVLFQFLLCEASKKNSSKFEINLNYLATFRRQTEAKILADLQELVKRGVIVTAKCRLVDDDVTPLLPATYERTNVTNERTNDIAQADAFAEFWAGYPRKVGKGKAQKLYRAAIKAGASPEDILAARDRYRDHLIREGTEPRFIKHGPTFLASWRDWLDPETGQAEDFSASHQGLSDEKIREILA